MKLLPFAFLLLLSCTDIEINDNPKPKYIIYEVHDRPFQIITNHYPMEIIPAYNEIETNYEMRFIMAMKPFAYIKYTNLKKENEIINKIYYESKSDVQLAKKSIDSDITLSIFKRTHWIKLGVGTNYQLLKKYKVGDMLFESNFKK